MVLFSGTGTGSPQGNNNRKDARTIRTAEGENEKSDEIDRVEIIIDYIKMNHLKFYVKGNDAFVAMTEFREIVAILTQSQIERIVEIKFSQKR